MKKSKFIMEGSYGEINALDIFVFRDDRLQKLDCYQRFDSWDAWSGSVVSGSGERIVTAIANSPYGRNAWTAVDSRPSLKKKRLNLEDEPGGSPMMAGEVHLTAGDDNASAHEKLQLQPFASEVVLRSISCDFSGKAYEGERIEDVKVYLINVNAECSVLEEPEGMPGRIINAGKLRDDDVLRFREPGIIMREIPEEIGRQTIYPDIRLLCYQSNHPEESPGTPYTRLVIEGKVSGNTYYWPVSINRDIGEETGIWRSRRYIYDIRITGKGSDDPDVPVRSEHMAISQIISKWEEKEEYGVSF